jgi:hypothetical protein
VRHSWRGCADLLDARLYAHDAAEILEIAGLGQRQGASAEGGEISLALQVHVQYLVMCADVLS